MINIDLVTGVLGAGKTTFIKGYANKLAERERRVGLIVNDRGAVNVDYMMLAELPGDYDLETVTGACDRDCWRRRFASKLIALKMRGCTRIVAEPSGVFDTEDFFDVLSEPQISRRIEVGSVIAVVDARRLLLADDDSPDSRMLACQIAGAGVIVLSHTDDITTPSPDECAVRLTERLKSRGCERELSADEIISAPSGQISDADFERIINAGRSRYSIPSGPFADDGCESLYFMNTRIPEERLRDCLNELFSDKKYGEVMRIKGCTDADGGYLEINAVRPSPAGDGDRPDIRFTANGQSVILVIGKGLAEEKIRSVLQQPS